MGQKVKIKNKNKIKWNKTVMTYIQNKCKGDGLHFLRAKSTHVHECAVLAGDERNMNNIQT